MDVNNVPKVTALVKARPLDRKADALPIVPARRPTPPEITHTILSIWAVGNKW